jgi:hypothetical protein
VLLRHHGTEVARHGFPAGLVQAESNLLGIHNGNSTNVGSGVWTNIIEKYTMNGGRSIERVSTLKLKRLYRQFE